MKRPIDGKEVEYAAGTIYSGGGMCLKYTLGPDVTKAKRIFDQVRKREPDTYLFMYEISAENCWWNDPFLAN